MNILHIAPDYKSLDMTYLDFKKVSENADNHVVLTKEDSLLHVIKSMR